MPKPPLPTDPIPAEQTETGAEPITKTPYRCMCYTYNNYTQEGLDKLKKYANNVYHIAAYEVSETGTPHIQGYIEFKTRTRLSTLKNLLPEQIHWEPRRGSQQQAIDYIVNDKEKHKDVPPKVAWIHGVPRPSNSQSDAYRYVHEWITSGITLKEIVEDPSYDLNPSTYKAWENLQTYFERKRNTKPEVIWIYGKPGAGKSRYAYDFGGDSIYKLQLGRMWYDGYDGQDCILWDDFDVDYPTDDDCSTDVTGLRKDASLKMLQRRMNLNLLDLTDRYEYRANKKGSSKQIVATKIIIVSHDPPWLLWRPEFRGPGPGTPLEVDRMPPAEQIECHPFLPQIMRRVDRYVYVRKPRNTSPISYGTFEVYERVEVPPLATPEEPENTKGFLIFKNRP